MKNPINNWLKQYFNFSKNDRNGIIILSILIFVTLIANIIVSNVQVESPFDYTEFENALNDWETKKIKTQQKKVVLFRFNPNTISKNQLDSFSLPDFVKRNLLNYRSAGGKFYSDKDVRKIYGMNDSIFATIKEYINIKKSPKFKVSSKSVSKKREMEFFDPNNASYKSLIAIGFNRYQAKNLISYRKNGGVFYSPVDVLKIYGVDSTFYDSIKNYIQIENIKPKQTNSTKSPSEPIELNKADSICLVKINGIGPVFASRILKYRSLLGGYYCKSQLLEVYNFPEETFNRIKNDLVTDTINIKKIRINFASFKELLKHPYLKKEQVQVILDYRTKNGSFNCLEEIYLNDLIDSTSFYKIKPYLSCR